MRSHAHVLAAAIGLAAGFISACSVYNPTVKDCSLRCSDDGKCPNTMECKEGFCRPPGATGACDCTAGDQEVCGGGQGECRTGVRICLDTRIWGPCLGEVRPQPETCDKKDNDCDGLIDDDVVNAPDCPLTMGVCMGATQTCIDGGFVNNCGPAVYGSKYELNENTCDGVDNDCNGSIDSLDPKVVASNAESWAAEAVPGGSFLFYTKAGSTIVHVAHLDDQLRPIGNEETIDPGGMPIDYFETHASNGGTVAMGFRRTDGTVGVLRASVSAPVPVQLNNPPYTPSTWALSVTSAGIVRGGYERDAGLDLLTWDTVNPTFMRTWRAFRVPATKVSTINLSYDSTMVAWNGDFDDGGTSDSVGAVESLEGSMTYPQTFSAGYYLIPTPGRLQAFRSFSTFFGIFPFGVDESGLTYCTNLTQQTDTCDNFAKALDHTQYHGGTATRVVDEMVVGWIENGGLYIGTALPTVHQIRSRNVPLSQVVEFSLLAPPGSNFLTIMYRTSTDASNVHAMLICPP